MEKLNNIVTILSTFSAIAVSLSAIIGVLSLIFKPVRNCIMWVYKKAVGTKNKNDEIIKKIDSVEKNLTEKVNTVESTLSSQIKEVSNRNDINEMKRIRWEILDFANSCKNKRRHSQDEYKHIIEMHDDYEELIGKTGSKNGFLEAEYDYILNLYKSNQDSNDFL